MLQLQLQFNRDKAIFSLKSGLVASFSLTYALLWLVHYYENGVVPLVLY